jgi:integral membrane sensor domain MASE1
MGILFLAYFGSAQIAAYLYSILGTSPTVVAPTAGIALAGLYLGGYAFWPAIFLGSIANSVVSGSGPLLTITLAIAAPLQAMVGVYVLKRFRFDPRLGRLRDSLALITTAIFISMITPTIAVTLQQILGVYTSEAAMTLWRSWWIGNILSILVIGAFLMRWIPRPRFWRTQAEFIEAGAALGLVVSISTLLFWTSFTSIGGISLLYILLIPLFWIAIRIGPRMMTLSLLLLAMIGVSGSIVQLTSTLAASALSDRHSYDHIPRVRLHRRRA